MYTAHFAPIISDGRQPLKPASLRAIPMILTFVLLDLYMKLSMEDNMFKMHKKLSPKQSMVAGK